MFSFLNPWFLVAAGAALVPLILHMMQRARTVRMPFSTLRFLRLADKKSSRRIKLEHFLLWLLRTLLMLLLACAFAMPMLRTTGFGDFLGRSQRDVALVIDTSFSMAYRTGRRTVWDKAVEAAVAVLDGLGERDRFCVYLAGVEVTPLIEQLSKDRDEATGYIKALKPAEVLSHLGPAVAGANEALAGEERRLEREIHILTDGQALPWQSFGRADTNRADATPVPGEWDPAHIADRTMVFVTRLGAPTPANVAPADVTIRPELVMADTALRIEAGLTHSGPAQDATVTLVVDGRDVARRATAVGGPEAPDLAFALPPLGPGTHAAVLQTPEDNLPIDDRLHFLIRTHATLPILCVGSAEDTLFVLTALRTGAGGQGGLDVHHVTVAELATKQPEEFTCIFLCNALPLPGQDIVRLEQYARAGGLLVVCPGDRAALGDYAAWQCLPGTPTAVTEVGTLDRRRALRWQLPRHALLRMLRHGASMPIVTLRRHIVWDPLHKDTAVLAAAGADTPFLITRPFGRGGVVMLAVPVDRTWSDFPLSPFYLPLLHQTVRFGAGIGVAAPFLWMQDTLSLRETVPEATAASILLDPGQREVPLRSAVVDGEPILYIEGLQRAGIYTLRETADADPAPVLALNVPRAESDLTPIASADIPEVLGLPRVTVADSVEELQRRIEEHRVGRTFGEALLWLALFAAALEFCYANFLLRSAPKLSQRLQVAESGKVGGRATG